MRSRIDATSQDCSLLYPNSADFGTPLFKGVEYAMTLRLRGPGNPLLEIGHTACHPRSILSRNQFHGVSSRLTPSCLRASLTLLAYSSSDRDPSRAVSS